MDNILLGISLMILLAVIGLILLNRVLAAAAADSNDSSKAALPVAPTNCNQCGQLPCQCAEVLPGKTRCPMCSAGSASLGPTAVPGVQCCDHCRRAYRCPGCLLG
jgi:hypothetical protein